MKKTNKFVAKTYKLTSDSTPLSYMLASRNSARYPLLHFDDEKGINRPMRYAKNQKSPFEDEQDGNAIKRKPSTTTIFTLSPTKGKSVC